MNGDADVNTRVKVIAVDNETTWKDFARQYGADCGGKAHGFIDAGKEEAAGG